MHMSIEFSYILLTLKKYKPGDREKINPPFPKPDFFFSFVAN